MDLSCKRVRDILFKWHKLQFEAKCHHKIFPEQFIFSLVVHQCKFEIPEYQDPLILINKGDNLSVLHSGKKGISKLNIEKKGEFLKKTRIPFLFER